MILSVQTRPLARVQENPYTDFLIDAMNWDNMK